jgi:hypothetical protein
MITGSLKAANSFHIQEKTLNQNCVVFLSYLYLLGMNEVVLSFLCVLFCLVLLGIESKALSILDKCSNTELHPYPKGIIFCKHVMVE